MRVLVKRGTCIGQGVDIYPGEVVELPERTARLYIAQGRVVPCSTPRTEDEAAATDAPPPYEPGTIQTSDPPVETMDPRPARGRPRRK